MGLEYAKARQLALRRAYPDGFDDDEPDFTGVTRVGAPLSAPGSPRMRSGMMTPGDYATLTEEMEHLGTTDYMGGKSGFLMLVPSYCSTLAFPSFSQDARVTCHVAFSRTLLIGLSKKERKERDYTRKFKLIPSILAGWKGINDQDDDENAYPFPLVMKPRNRSDSLASAISGTATPSGGRKLSEKDLLKVDEGLSHHTIAANGNGNGNGH